MTTKSVTTKNVTEQELKSLKAAAGRAGDFRQVGLCVLALDGEIDFDDWTVFDGDDRAFLGGFTRETALVACVEALNNGG